MKYYFSQTFWVYCSLFALIVVLAFQTPTPPTETPITLGKRLFFEKKLSKDQSISCATCHQPRFAFADNRMVSSGVHDSLGVRNTPSVMNMAFRPYFFYDGRAATLEEQAIGPIQNTLEMHLPFPEAVRRIQADTSYDRMFREVYQQTPDSALIVDALARFMESLESDGSAPHDLWVNGIDTNALSAAQLRGRELFIGKAKCFDCHFGPDFTGDEFRNVGLYDGKTLTDRGRFEISKDSSDLGKFKVPGLRNVALTAPYMHNGMFASLEEVVDFYDDPSQFVENPINMDTLLQEPLGLTPQEKADLVAFMHSLTDKNIPYADEVVD